MIHSSRRLKDLIRNLSREVGVFGEFSFGR